MSTDVSPSKQIPHIRELPLLGSFRDFTGDRLGLFMRISQECPEIGAFQVGPMRMLLITSGQLAQSVLINQADEFFSGKLLQALVPLMGARNLIIIHGEEHRQQRKLLAPAFQPRRLSDFAAVMADYAAQMVAGWAEGEVIDITEQMPLVTMRVVGKTLFDVDFKHEARELNDAMTVSVDYLDYLSSSLVPLPLSWPTPRNARTRRALATIRNQQTAIIEERRRNPGKDMLSSLIGFRDENGQGLTDEQLRDHASTIFVAGHETVAIGMSWAWYLLQHNPEAYAKLRQEVDSVLGGRLPTAEDLPKLSYTLQVVKEAMRLYPPGYIISRAPLHDTRVNGYEMKTSDTLLISPYTLHRNPDLYPEPEKFLPERFTPEAEKTRPRYSYLPFSAGPHTCLGNFFALMEAQLLMSVMVQRVNLEALPGQNVVAHPGVSLRMSSYKLRVSRRAPVERPQATSASA